MARRLCATGWKPGHTPQRMAPDAAQRWEQWLESSQRPMAPAVRLERLSRLALVTHSVGSFQHQRKIIEALGSLRATFKGPEHPRPSGGESTFSSLACDEQNARNGYRWPALSGHLAAYPQLFEYLCASEPERPNPLAGRLWNDNDSPTRHQAITERSWRELPTAALESLWWELVAAPGSAGMQDLSSVLYTLSERPVAEWSQDLARRCHALAFDVPPADRPDFDYGGILRKRDSLRQARLKILTGQGHPAAWNEALRLLIEGKGNFQSLYRIDADRAVQFAAVWAATTGRTGVRVHLCAALEELQAKEAIRLADVVGTCFAPMEELDRWQRWTAHRLLHGAWHEDEVDSQRRYEDGDPGRHAVWVGGTRVEAESVSALRARDAATLEWLGLTHDQIAAPLWGLLERARRKEGHYAWVPHGNAGWQFRYEDSMGHHECVWGDHRDPCWFEGSLYATVRDDQGQEFKFAGMLAHYISAHQYFEGSVGCRVEPLEVALFFGLPCRRPREEIVARLIDDYVERFRSGDEAQRSFARGRLRRYVQTYVVEPAGRRTVIERLYPDVATLHDPQSEAIAVERYQFLFLLAQVDAPMTEAEVEECATLGARCDRHLDVLFQYCEPKKLAVFRDRDAAWWAARVKAAYPDLAETPFVDQTETSWLRRRERYLELMAVFAKSGDWDEKQRIFRALCFLQGTWDRL